MYISRMFCISNCWVFNKENWNYLHGMNNVKTVLEKNSLFRIWKNLVYKNAFVYSKCLKHVILTD